MKRFPGGWEIGNWVAVNAYNGYNLYNPEGRYVGLYTTLKACRMYALENDWRYRQ